MAFDEHDFAALIVGIYSPRSVADEQCFYAQLIHHMNGKRGEVDWVAFIKMETPLHRNNVSASKAAANQLPLVPRCRAFRKEGDLFVGKY